MDFQYDYSAYTQDDFYQDQGVQHFTLQAGGTYFHGVDPTTGSGAFNQPVFWPENHGNQPQQNPGLFNNPIALPQFLPASDIQTFHPVPPQKYQGMTLQDGAVYFDVWPQGPVMFVDVMGQQHGTSVAPPQLQAPLVAMSGASPHYDAPVPCVPHLQAPTIYVDDIGQQHGATVPFDPQLQVPLMLVEGAGLGHGTTVHLDPFAEPFEPMDTTDVKYSTIVSYNPVPAPSEPVQLISNQQLPVTEQLTPNTTGLMTPALLTQLPAQQNEVQTKAPTAVEWSTLDDLTTSELMKPQLTTSMVVAEARTPAISDQQLPLTEQLTPSTAGLMTSASLTQLPTQQNEFQTKAPTAVEWSTLDDLTTSELMKPQLTMSMVVAEAKAPAIHQPDPGQAFTSLIPGISHSQDSLVVELHGAMENNKAKASDNLVFTLVELRAVSVEAVKEDANLPKNSLPENAEKGTKRKRQINKTEEERRRKRRRNETSPTAWTAIF